ncbi:G protein pathway suppressor 2 isoform X3 [Strongylocentrotus purpuratus]|nr:G protein pathway suppressor 2 isoform X3 [Strongylocentrotus purpuratus]
MPALLERPKLSKAMASALRVHVVKERERKRQEEEEADKAIERKKQEQERLRKRQEAETLSLEETKEQVNNMEEKLKSLQQEKHELFLQLKKVLNEDENRRRQQESKKNEMLVAMSQSYHPAMQLPGPHMLVQSGSLARPTLLGDGPKGHYYRGTQTPPSQTVQQSVKRSRSPSPPVVDLYPKHHIQGSHYPHVAYTQSQVTHAHSPYRQQGHIAYTTAQAPSASFINQSASGYPPTQQPVHANYASSSQSNPNKYQARESAFSSYGNHFATAQKGIAEQISQSYQQQQQQQHQQQQQQQQRYLQGAPSSSLHSASHHGVEQSRKASSEGDDQGYYQAKLQGQQHLRQLNSGHPQAIHHPSSHQPLLTQGQVQAHIQPAQTKPSIPTSFATHGRRKTDSPVYHKKPSQQHGSNYPPGQGGGGRSGYGSAQGQHQGTTRYY